MTELRILGRARTSSDIDAIIEKSDRSLAQVTESPVEQARIELLAQAALGGSLCDDEWVRRR